MSFTFGGMYPFGGVEKKGAPEAPMTVEVAAEKEERKSRIAGFSVPEVLSAQVGNAKFSDVTFVVGEEKDQEKIPAHRILLALRSPVFESMLYKYFAEQKDAAATEIVIKNASPEIFRLLLNAIYTDKPRINPDNVQPLLALAKRYQVESVIELCTRFVTEGFTVDNVCAWFSRTIENTPEAKSSLTFIEDNTKAVLASEGFSLLSADDVIRICRSNRLAIAELDLFNAVLKWAGADAKRRAESKADGKDGKDVKEVKTASKAELLKDILPHIRFPLMDMETLAGVISPAGVIPPDHLVGLFTYVGSRTDAKDGQFIPAPKGLPYPVHPREPRRPLAYFKWDSKAQSGGVEVSADGLTASMGGYASQWLTIFGNVRWKPRTGVYDYEVTLEQYDMQNTWNIIMGVVPADYNAPAASAGTPIAYAGQSGWACVLGASHLIGPSNTNQSIPYNGGRRRGQGQSCKPGDVIGVRYDSDRGTIEFFKRGRPWPESNNIIRGISGTVKPGISMIMAQRVKLSFNAKFSMW